MMFCGLTPFHKTGRISKRLNGTSMYVRIKTTSNCVTYLLQHTIKTIHSRPEHTMTPNVPLSWSHWQTIPVTGKISYHGGDKLLCHHAEAHSKPVKHGSRNLTARHIPGDWFVLKRPAAGCTRHVYSMHSHVPQANCRKTRLNKISDDTTSNIWNRGTLSAFASVIQFPEILTNDDLDKPMRQQYH